MASELRGTEQRGGERGATLGAPNYDSGEEFEREEAARREEAMRKRMTATAAGRPPTMRLIRNPRPQQAHVPPVRVTPASSGFTPARAAPSIAHETHEPRETAPAAAAAGPPPQPALPHSAAAPAPAASSASSFRRPAAPAPLMAAFPATVFWADKLGVLGAVHLVSEALVRTILMDSEEFADRVAWVCVERLVTGLVATLGQASSSSLGAAPSSAPSSAPSATASRARALSEIRRQLGEIRATHSAFHSASNHSLVHGAILVLLRACHLAQLSSEMALSPYAWSIDRHVQEIVFQCDFAAMVLAKVEIDESGPHVAPLVEERPDAPQLFLPAHYSNEALLRALPLLDLRDSCDEDKRTPATCATLARILNEHAQSISNEWLRRNLTRLAAGLSIAGGIGSGMEQEEAAGTGDAETTARFLDAAVENIMRERAQAINTWKAWQGSEMGNMFTDPLYRIEAEIDRGRA